MGITNFSIHLLDDILANNIIESVAELGDQNLYTNDERYGAYANIYYEDNDIEYTCIDLNGGNGALKWDLRAPRTIHKQYDLVTDFGVTEHVSTDKGDHKLEYYYNAWKIKHDLLKIGGIMVNENPMHLNWPRHGANYLTEQFYEMLHLISDYKILKLGVHPAMGNTTDGYNVYCVLQKTGSNFPSLRQFKTLPVYDK